jgi:hypothetical protein
MIDEIKIKLVELSQQQPILLVLGLIAWAFLIIGALIDLWGFFYA